MTNGSVNVKMYRVRKGYTWTDEHGMGCARTTIAENDPGFEGQKHKLESIPSETLVSIESVEAPEDEAPVKEIDRMIRSSPRKR